MRKAESNHKLLNLSLNPGSVKIKVFIIRRSGAGRAVQESSQVNQRLILVIKGELISINGHNARAIPLRFFLSI